MKSALVIGSLVLSFSVFAQTYSGGSDGPGNNLALEVLKNDTKAKFLKLENATRKLSFDSDAHEQMVDQFYASVKSNRLHYCQTGETRLGRVGGLGVPFNIGRRKACIKGYVQFAKEAKLAINYISQHVGQLAEMDKLISELDKNKTEVEKILQNLNVERDNCQTADQLAAQLKLIRKAENILNSIKLVNLFFLQKRKMASVSATVNPETKSSDLGEIFAEAQNKIKWSTENLGERFMAIKNNPKFFETDTMVGALEKIREVESGVKFYNNVMINGGFFMSTTGDLEERIEQARLSMSNE